MGTFRVIFISLLLSVVSITAESLILVDAIGGFRSQVPVVDIVDGKHIVLAAQQHLTLLKGNNVAFNHLDGNTEGKKYYLVYPFKNTPDEFLPVDEKVISRYGKVLAAFNKCLLVQSTAEMLNSITEYNTRIDLVELEPLEFNRNNTIVKSRTGPIQSDPLIEEMMERVNADSADKFLRDLCAFHNRHVRQKWNRDEMCPWLAQKFLDYGCDSIIELPLGDNYGTLVAGVRYGLEDPSINTFTLVGGHNDTKTSDGETARHQGANDNATGTVGVLEACRVHQYYQFDNTIIYAGFNGEEVGFLGSAALMKALDGAGAKVIGGCFAYDMLGLYETSSKFKIYSGIDGYQQFMDDIEEISDLYDTYDVSVSSTSTSKQSTDITNIWKYDYVGAMNNYSGASGGIHNAGDSIISRYDPEHMADITRTGIAVTAYYGVPHEITGTVNFTPKAKPATVLSCTRTPARNFIITVSGKQVGKHGVLTIFNLHGKSIKRFSVAPNGEGETRISWDGTNGIGRKVASGALYLVRYTSGSSTAFAKVLVK